MRHLFILLIAAALVGCDRAAGEPDVPELTGTWESLAGGDSLRLHLSEQNTSVSGVADWGSAQFTVTGSHAHPGVSLELKGPFTQTRVVALRGSLPDPNTIQGTLSTSGFPDQPVTLRRRAR